MAEAEENISVEHFEKWESKKVQIQYTDQDTREAFITNVKSLIDSEEEDRRSFSFELATQMTQEYYPQGTYLVTFPDGMEQLVFMVPIGVDGSTGGIKYEVIFN